MSLLWYLVIVGLGAAAVVAIFRDKKRSEESARNYKEKMLSEENVAKRQAHFERRLDDDADLPDVIKWRKAYIYRDLMSKWFAQLIAKYRYDDAISRKLRADWLGYIYLLETGGTARFLELEASTSARSDAHGEEAERAKRR